MLALDALGEREESLTCNLGNGEGYSVREVIDAAREVTGRPIPADEIAAPARRRGDPGGGRDARRGSSWAGSRESPS